MKNIAQIRDSLSIISEHNTLIGQSIKAHLIQLVKSNKIKQVENSMGSIYFTSFDKDLKGREMSVVLHEVVDFFKGVEFTTESLLKEVELRVKDVKEDLSECTNSDDLEVLTYRLNRTILMGQVANEMVELFSIFKYSKKPHELIIEYCPSFCHRNN